MATYVEQSLAKLKVFEGCVPWMYRDTVGKITVGVGLMLPDAGAAVALPFLMAGRAATAAEIEAEFARVMELPEGRAAGFYKLPGSVELGSATIDAKLSEVLEGFAAKLRAAIGGYDGFPDCVKMALLDMAYNLGPAGLLTGYPHLIAAVKQGRWTEAASDCERHGPSAARNAWTREQFLNATAGTVGRIEGAAEGRLKRFWRRVSGL